MSNTDPTTPWPAQLMLPGQAAAPPGPVDMTMMYVMHHAFRRDLTAFAVAAAATPVHQKRTWAALARRWNLFATALHAHHRGEDSGVWPKLTSRADVQGRRVLAAMESEHSEIDPILDLCAAGLRRLAAGADEDTRAALVVRLVAAKESLARHLAHEETDAIRLIQQLITEHEWRALEKEHFKPDKISLGMLVKLISWVMHDLPSAGKERVLHSTPLMSRTTWQLTRRWFERGERRAFCYQLA